MAHFYYYFGKKCCHLNRGSFFVKRSDSNTTCGNPLFVNTPIDEIQKWYSNNFMFEIFFVPNLSADRNRERNLCPRAILFFVNELS